MMDEEQQQYQLGVSDGVDWWISHDTATIDKVVELVQATLATGTEEKLRPYWRGWLDGVRGTIR